MTEHAISANTAALLRQSTSNLSTASPQATKRSSALRCLGQIGLLIALFMGVKAIPGVGQFAGQLGMLVCMIAATLMLRRDGQTWADMGLRWARTSKDLAKGAGMVVAVLVASVGAALLVQAFVLPALGVPVEIKAPNISTLTLYLLIMATVWTTNAFGEEMVMRGFIMGRLSTMFGGTKGAWILAAFAQAVIFGFGHYAQGTAGIISTGVIGVVFGLLYLVAKRNLWPLIIAHGLFNSFGMTMLFLQQSGAAAGA